ncbi:MAG: hypothetical protein C0594_06160 [Marinilabiliales bacterium]|nr:MAG: hypothetical protein C0594_06160 [Marinilabiliales bacterium]
MISMKKLAIYFLFLPLLGFVSCGGGDDDYDDDYTDDQQQAMDYKDYYGKWTMTSVSSSNKSKPERINGQVHNLKTDNQKVDMPNLTFYTLNGWSAPVQVNEGDPQAGELMNIGWGIANNGTAVAGGLVTLKIGFYLDNNYLFTLERSLFMLDPGNYYGDGFGTEISDPWSSLPTLTEGNHSLRVVYDTDNSIDESNENDNEYTLNFYVAPTPVRYTSFEFGPNRFKAIDGVENLEYYGSFSDNGGSYSLNGFPATVSNIQVSGSTITLDVTENKSGTMHYTGTLDTRIPETSMTLKLMNGSWKLTATDHGNPAVNQDWLFMPGGTYCFENNDGNTETHQWFYINDSEFEYNIGNPENGTAYIDEITETTLEIHDYQNTYYSFEKN